MKTRNLQGSIASWIAFFGLGALILVSGLIASEVIVRTVTLNRVQHALREGAITYARDMLRLRDNALSEVDPALYRKDLEGLALSSLSTADNYYYNCLQGGCSPIKRPDPNLKIPTETNNTEYLNASQVFLSNLSSREIQRPDQINNLLQSQCSESFSNSSFARILEKSELNRREKEECSTEAIGNISKPIMSLTWEIKGDSYKSGVCCPVKGTDNNKKDFCVEMTANLRLQPVFLSGFPFLSQLDFIKEGSFKMSQRVVAFKGNGQEALLPEQIPPELCAPSIPPARCDHPSLCPCEIKSSGDFNENYYLKQNPDVRKLIAQKSVQTYNGVVYGPFESAQDHYIQVGKQEGRWCDKCIRSCNPSEPKCNVACNSSEDCSDSNGKNTDGCSLCDLQKKICVKPTCGDSCDSSGACKGSTKDCIFCDPIDSKCKTGKCGKKCISHDQCLTTNDGCSACIRGACRVPECGTPCHKDEVCQGAILLNSEKACPLCIQGKCDTPGCNKPCRSSKECNTLGNLDGCTYCKINLSGLFGAQSAGNLEDLTNESSNNQDYCTWDLNNYLSADNQSYRACKEENPSKKPCEIPLDTCLGPVESFPEELLPAGEVSKVFVCECPEESSSGLVWDAEGRTAANNSKIPFCQERANDTLSINGASCSEEASLCKAPAKENQTNPAHSVKLFKCVKQTAGCKLDFQGAFTSPKELPVCRYNGDTVDGSSCKPGDYPTNNRCRAPRITNKDQISRSSQGRKLYRCNCDLGLNKNSNEKLKSGYFDLSDLSGFTGKLGVCVPPACGMPCSRDQDCFGNQDGCTLCQLDQERESALSERECSWDLNNYLSSENNSASSCTEKGVIGDPSGKSCNIELDTCLGGIEEFPPDLFPETIKENESVSKVFACDCAKKSPTGLSWDLKGRTEANNPKVPLCQSRQNDGLSINGASCSKEASLCKAPAKENQTNPAHSVKLFICKKQTSFCSLDFQAFAPSGTHELCSYTGETIDHSPCSIGEYKNDRCQAQKESNKSIISQSGQGKKLFRCNCLDSVKNKNIQELNVGNSGFCASPSCGSPCTSHSACAGNTDCNFCIAGVCSAQRKCYWDVNNIVEASNNSAPTCADQEPNQKICRKPLSTCLGPVREDSVPYAKDGEKVSKIFKCECPTNSPTGLVWDLDGRTSSNNQDYPSCQSTIQSEGFELNEGSINNSPCSQVNMKCRADKNSSEETNVKRFVCVEQRNSFCKLDFQAYAATSNTYPKCGTGNNKTIDDTLCSPGEYGENNLCQAENSKIWNQSLNDSRRELFRCNCEDVADNYSFQVGKNNRLITAKNSQIRSSNNLIDNLINSINSLIASGEEVLDSSSLISLENTSFLEEQKGKEIGKISVNGNNKGLNFRILNDSSGGKFEIVDNTLKLKKGISLDFERDPKSYRLVLEVTDSQGNKLTQSILLRLKDGNDPPTNISLSNNLLDENQFGGEIGILTTSDPNLPNDSHEYKLINDPSGKLEIIGNSLRLKANSFFNYEETSQTNFRIRVKDSAGHLFGKSFVLKINDLNEVPKARNFSLNTNEDFAIRVAVIPNLASDPDQKDDLVLNLAGEKVKTSQGGSVTFSKKTFLYQPRENFAGEDFVDYSVTDGNSTASARITIRVLEVNDPPVAREDNYQSQQGVSKAIGFNSILSNDFDLEGAVRFEKVDSSSLQGGSVSRNGSFLVYSPPRDFNGIDSFNYSISDQDSAKAQGKITINVINRAPRANLDRVTLIFGKRKVRFDPVANDTDPENKFLSVIATKAGTYGDIFNVGGNRFEYRLADQEGIGKTDTIQYTLQDDQGNTDTGLIEIAIKENTKPEANSDSFSTEKNKSIDIFESDLLGNDSDRESAFDLHAFNKISREGGTIEKVEDGGKPKFIYTPALNFQGKDRFNYSIIDKEGKKDSAAVIIEVI